MGLLARLCAAILTLSMSVVVSAAPVRTQTATVNPVSPRQTVNLSSGWRFRFGGDQAGVTTAGFDDSGWEHVSVPHSWNRVGEYSLTRSAATDSRQGVGWYRLNFTAPAAAKGRRQYLDFAAVAIVADVWVNGVHVGQHKGAFSRFRFDVTAAWKPAAANLIVVKADNSKPAIGSSTQDVIPLAGDFFIHGGIYRGVSLITANDVGIDLLDMGGSGVYARGAFQDVLGDLQRFRTVDGMQARIPVRVRLRNSGGVTRRLDVTATIRDAAGTVVVTSATPSTLKAGSTDEALIQAVVANPHLWNGVADPYRYTLTIAVAEKGVIVDETTQPLGIRAYNFDPDTGFSLNGKLLPLHGVSRHQDRMGKGYALSRADAREDMDLIAEMGANTVRMAHYQHDDAWADEADAHGIVAWAEVPFVTTPSLNGGEGSPALWANAEQQLRELIRQNYNHPSIMMWSIGNEVDAAKGFGMAGEAPKPLALLKHLAEVAREEDPSRPTTFADCCEDVGMMMTTAGEKLAGTADLIGYNRYYGWYMPKPLNARADLGAKLDSLHVKHPTVPMSISEYGAGGAITQHSDNPSAGFLNFVGRPQPEEYQSLALEANWPAIRERRYVFASWVWNMFDFASGLRNEGDSVDINTKGLVLFDHKTKKDGFYYFKAQWNPAPMIHLNSQRYVDRPYPAADVRAYTSAAAATLTVNGAVVGDAPCPDHVCVWPGVALKPGPNLVKVSIPGLSDLATWNGPDPARGIRIDAGDLASHVVDGRLFGSDNFVTGGSPSVLNMGGFGNRRATPKVVAAPDPALYDYWREGEAFSYAIPMPNGKWTVTIHTFEPRSATPGALAMTVTANGKVAVPAFNVASAAGGPLKGLVRSFPVVVKDGALKLDFAAVGGKAVVAAIEVAK